MWLASNKNQYILCKMILWEPILSMKIWFWILGKELRCCFFIHFCTDLLLLFIKDTIYPIKYENYRKPSIRSQPLNSIRSRTLYTPAAPSQGALNTWRGRLQHFLQLLYNQKIQKVIIIWFAHLLNSNKFSEFHRCGSKDVPATPIFILNFPRAWQSF